MRILVVVSTILFMALVGALLLWRPAVVLALSLLGGAYGLWRLRKPAPAKVRTAAAPARPAPPAAIEVPAPAPEADLATLVAAAGWTLAPASRGEPWLLIENGAIRIALRPAPIGAAAGAQDIMDGLSAKQSEAAHYAAIVCTQRPEEHVAERAKQAHVHMINLERLDAYLTLAGSFGQPAAPPEPALA